jgi:hypothetical protein
MKLAGILMLLLPLFVPLRSHSQRPSPLTLPPTQSEAEINAAAAQAWEPFFERFRAAVKRRDRAALKAMMVPHFFVYTSQSIFNSDGRDDALRRWDLSTNEKDWKSFEKVLEAGVVDPSLNGNRKWSPPRRVAPPDAATRGGYRGGPPPPGLVKKYWMAVFEYLDGHWFCTAFFEAFDN